MTGPGTADTLASAGERAALARILAILPRSLSAEVGPGDDAAVVRAPDGRFVVTTDTMVHGPDFRLAWSTLYDLGWKAAVTNLSDVAAMGAAPTSLIIALTAPGDTTLDDLEAFARGVTDACAEHAPGCALVGGDLSVSDTLTIAVTAFGDLEGRQPVLRSGARTGDTLAVAGTLGRAGAGIALLFDRAVSVRDGARTPNREAFQALGPEHGAVLEAQLRPRSPLNAGVEAALAGATAMMDISDGLVLDASRLAEASGVTITIDPGALDIEADRLRHSAPDLVGDPRALVLGGGEDHALLATFPPSVVLPDGWRPIGMVRDAEKSGFPVYLGTERLSETGAGWDPYRAWDGRSG